MSVFRPAERFVRVLQSLLGVLVPGEVVALSVTDRSSTMGVRSLFMELRGSLM
jgi:hypothetical protein